MRCCSLVVCLLLHVAASAQPQQPIAFANTYTYTDADGITDYANTQILSMPDGRRYSYSISTGKAWIWRNNSVTPLPDLPRAPGAPCGFAPATGNDVWYYSGRAACVIHNDSVGAMQMVPAAGKYAEIGVTPTSLYYFPISQTGIQHFWLFDGRRFQELSWPQITGSRHLQIFPNPRGGYFLLSFRADSLYFYSLDAGQPSPPRYLNKSYYYPEWGIIAELRDADNWTSCISEKNTWLACSAGNLHHMQAPAGVSTLLHHNDLFLSSYNNNLYRLWTSPTDSGFYFEHNDRISSVVREGALGSYNVSTGNKPIRIFPWLHHYPRIFNGSNSAGIFSLGADDKGRIWAGSYNGSLSIIGENNIKELPYRQYRWINGSSFWKGAMYLISETIGGGLTSVNSKGVIHTNLSEGVLGFYNYVSRDGQYFYYGGNAGADLWRCPVATLAQGKAVWDKIDSTRGEGIINILTIAEDTLGRIWHGHGRQGLAVYDPEKGTVKTWLRESGATPFGPLASLTDHHGAVWMASRDGLWCYNDYSKPPAPQSCFRLKHPLLQGMKNITALTICNNWLIIAAYDKVLALDLRSYYATSKTVLRYLNPQEASFTSFTEQNTLITARDSSVWFSTSDMLYRWDFLQWLKLAAYKAALNVRLESSGKNLLLASDKAAELPPGFNSFDLRLEVLSPDAMPRYMRAALVRDGDTTSLPLPSLQSIFSIKNIASGHYKFIIEVFEQDGSTSRYEYPIIMRRYFWQNWWFWAACSLLLLAIMAWVFNTQRQKSIALQTARRKDAELKAYKSAQEKALSDLQLVTLSNQFRPHFILNALNTIGGRMHDKPEIESVLSRLGESVNLIFNHTRRKEITHPFHDEWALVVSLIQIHKLMYLKELKTLLPGYDCLLEAAEIKIPMGILQIPVENALLHGLSNREEGPWILEISCVESQEHFTITITDNGIGRKRAAMLSNATKHGTGISNQEEVLAIINRGKKQQITVNYEDEPLNGHDRQPGTRCIIVIPKNFSYGAG